MSQEVLEEYRKTLENLNRLLRRKKRQRAGDKHITLVRQEIDEVTDVIRHLEKRGEKRWKWEL